MGTVEGMRAQVSGLTLPFYGSTGMGSVGFDVLAWCTSSAKSMAVVLRGIADMFPGRD